MIKRLAATAAIALTALYAAPSFAGSGFSGYYLIQFKYPGGTFYQCAKLVPENGAVPGYKFGGKWFFTSYANSGGEYVVFNNTIHLAGTVDDGAYTDYIALDGKLSGGSTIGATFDYFTNNTAYIAAGSLKEVKTSECK